MNKNNRTMLIISIAIYISIAVGRIMDNLSIYESFMMITLWFIYREHGSEPDKCMINFNHKLALKDNEDYDLFIIVENILKTVLSAIKEAIQ